MTEDGWQHLRALTDARIALGRSGGSLPTARLLEFKLAHARARDAVHAVFDAERLAGEINDFGLQTIIVNSAAGDLHEYLLNPNNGRVLSENSRRAIRELAKQPEQIDCALIVADGLSSAAVQAHAAGVLRRLAELLRAKDISHSPVVIVRHGRVAIEDEIGELLGARAACILIGERPGLGSTDSLGAYTVFDPQVGRTDAERNCVSNIRPQGLRPPEAAETVAWLVSESIRRKISGVALKDDRQLMQEIHRPLDNKP